MEAWNIKSIVGSLFSSGLGEELYPGTSLPVPDTGTGVTERLLWKGIFRKEPSELERIGALEAMADVDEHADVLEGDLGIRDEEDGVYRCHDCLHELWEGVCTHCERIYPAHLDFDLGPFGEEDDVDSLDGRMPLDGDDIGIHVRLGGGGAVRIDLDDDDDDGYESSFIDDDNNRIGARPAVDLTVQLGRNARNGRRPRAESVIDISSGEEDEKDGHSVDSEDDDIQGRADADTDTDTDDEEEVAIVGPGRRGRSRFPRGPFVPSDDEDEEEEDSGEEFLNRRRTRPRHQPIYDPDEDEDHVDTLDDENDDFHRDEEYDGIRYSDEDLY